MTLPCAGRLALITGASRGIGQALAVRLAAEGARVAAVSRTACPGDGRYPGSLTETVALAAEAGGTALAIPADIRSGEGRHRAVREAEEHFGLPVTLLVNNAAAPRVFDLAFDQMTEEAFREAVEVNVWAAWDLARAVVPGMVRDGAGWILNITSAQARHRIGPPYGPNRSGGACLYGGTKAMVDRMTTGAAMDLHGRGVAVNALAPEGAVRTDHAAAVADLPAHATEPMETFVEAALALLTGDPDRLTGRVTGSLSLVVELGLSVRSLDGRREIEGWQPGEIDPSRLRTV
ncbi:SDR family NAD(P)-dependent oxidoreductase [Actinomadura kijaniata]|uniref:SDR family NAD(P)-dependent oxidoreductase n=1 Tax=Actinomadura kijaniata TaxID=46161 RepID=UPI0008338C86|nr:SDR family NAD(P)-dependent oxidoreductase [Actinomadura kijaniata]